MSENIYDIVIIGGGPAGLTAGLYAKRAAMNTVLLERYLPGGQVLLTERIENYPGFPEGITGLELINRMKEQALSIGLAIREDNVIEIKEEKGPAKNFKVITESGSEYKTLSVILAAGATWKHLGVPGEEKFAGRGVSYCATCDGPMFRNKKVVVVGGGDKAVEEGIYLTKFANEVTLIHRRDRLRAAKILQEALFKNKKINLSLNSVVTSIEGDKVVSGVKIKDVRDGKEKEIACQGAFIFIGVDPNSLLLKDKTKTDESGYILTDNNMQTSTEGIFACGDVRNRALQQIVVATGEGAQAAVSAQKYAETLKGTAY
ncbi:MAG: thioredoxin-disulfide reductase [Candidatus Omnitrophica bacterium]|nr:thioredoxin-disulfide reductase [Candidatus Omnitrophota bacterium]MBU4487894.1 thioredoxin-disulfide reductase [Candidatus Omnitrophota bacterium]MCG2705517.1 thioredoxin-disulfide reductase [Candidatus Omnitrophota bacterium]